MEIHVKGGTNGGNRKVREKPEPWRCECHDNRFQARLNKLRPGYLVACPDCGARRP